MTLARNPDNLLANKGVLVKPIPALVLEHLVAYAGEESGPAVVVILGPALEWMIVTLRAGQAYAKKHLGRVLGPAEDLAIGSQIVCRRVSVGAAAGGQKLPGKGIERFPRGETLPDPPVEKLYTLSVKHLLLVTKKVAPLQRPEISETSALEQLVNLARPLSRILVLAEVPGLGSGGQPTREVKCRATQKNRVGAERGWVHAQVAKLTEDGLIDKILLPGSAPLIALRRWNEGHPDRSLPAKVPDENSALAKIGPAEKTTGGHSDGLSYRLIDRELTYIPPCPI